MHANVLSKSLLGLPIVYWIALATRLLWSLLIDVAPVSDSNAYDVFAVNIWQHGTYGWTPNEPTSFWPVGTSAIYAAIYSLFGHSYVALELLHLALGLFCVHMTRLLCFRFFDKAVVGDLAALLLALWPTGIMFTTVLASEIIYTAFILGALHVFASNWRSYVLLVITGGILFSAAYYVRPTASVALLCVTLSCVFILHQKWQHVILRVTLTAFLMVLAVTPWAIRNHQLHNAFVPMSSNGGVVFWMGNTKGSDGGYMNTPAELSHLDTYEKGLILKERAIQAIKEDPMHFAEMLMLKFYKFHSHETIGVNWNAKGIQAALGDAWVNPLKALTQLYWLLILALGVCGLWVYFRTQTFVSFLFHPFTLMWASSAGIHTLIAAQDRYHLPTVPFIAGFAALAIVKILDLRTPKQAESNTQKIG